MPLNFYVQVDEDKCGHFYSHRRATVHLDWVRIVLVVKDTRLVDTRPNTVDSTFEMNKKNPNLLMEFGGKCSIKTLGTQII